MTDEMTSRFEPTSVSHPGETIADYLHSYSWSQRDLARRTGLTPKTISEICSGKASVSPTTALALEKVLRRPAHFWLNLQRQFDEAEARRETSKNISQWQSWARKFPIAEMRKYQLLNVGSSDAAADALLSFFGVTSPGGWQSVWDASNVAYRQTRKQIIRIEAVSAWTRATELKAQEIETEDFDQQKLISLLDELRVQTREPAERFTTKVQDMCATAGVAVVWVPELKQTGISGCARWLSDRKALIGLTLRYKTDDQMWFTFFHELGHILLHRKQHSFVLDNAAKDLSDSVVDPKMQKSEEEANRFAADTLIPPEALSVIMTSRDLSDGAIKAFADELGIGPGIIVGRLQSEGILAYHEGNALKRKFEWDVSGDSSRR